MSLLDIFLLCFALLACINWYEPKICGIGQDTANNDEVMAGVHCSFLSNLLGADVMMIRNADDKGR